MGLRLKDKKIDTIYSSDLARAADTAKIIAEELDQKVIYTSKIRERNLGILEGQLSSQFPEGLQKLCDHKFSIDKAETLQELINRADSFIQYIKQNNSEKIVLIVAHAGINTGFVAALNKIPVKNFNTIKVMKHEDILEFDV